MFFQPFNVIAWLHAGKANVPYKAPSLKAVERDSVPCLTIDYEEAEDKTAPAEVASAAFYPCAKIIPQDQDGILLCAPEIQRLVDLALKGHNAAVIMLDVGGANAEAARRNLLYQTVTKLNLELCNANAERKKNNVPEIQLDYAHIGIVDNCCYDLKNGQRIENSKMLDNGLESIIRRSKQKDSLWSKVKESSKVPSILYMRLVDPSKLLGRLLVVDLHQPDFTRAIDMKPSASLHHSFERLRELFKNFSERKGSSLTDPKGPRLDVDSCVLSKFVGPFLCGLGVASMFMHFDTSLHYDVDDTVEALHFMSALSSVQCISVPNESDIRVDYYKSRLAQALKEANNKETYVDTKYQKQLEACQEELRTKSLEMKENMCLLEQMTRQQEKLEKQLQEAIESREKSVNETADVDNEQQQAYREKRTDEGLIEKAAAYDLAKKQSEILSLKDELRCMRANLESTIIRTELVELEKNDQAKELTSLKKDYGNLLKEFDELKQLISAMEEKLKGNEKEINAYKSLIQNIKAKYHAKNEKRVIAWKEREHQYQMQIEKMEEDMVEATQILTAFEADQQALRKGKHELLSKISEQDAAYIKLQNQMDKLKDQLDMTKEQSQRLQKSVAEYKERWKKESEWNQRECAIMQDERQRMRLYMGHLKQQILKQLGARAVDTLLADADKVTPSIEASYVQSKAGENVIPIAISPSDLVKAGEIDLEMPSEADSPRSTASAHGSKENNEEVENAIIQKSRAAAPAQRISSKSLVNKGKTKATTRPLQGDFSANPRSSAISAQQDKRPFALMETSQSPTTPGTPSRTPLQNLRVNTLPNKRRRIDTAGRRINKQ